MRKEIGKCKYCNNSIFDNDKYKTLNANGDKIMFHIQCFRKVRKEAKNLMKEGFINF
ncbi:hypothetical protein MJ1_0692 [Nanobdella aerobiophila]|uniref:Uncharacterized protein n=1 Tax=Nanobdella aerobiophila TaxID=2586965 RepID=A0A915WS05_9ARCH|nr:hypothetical protein [Nanobdella aerobiophila]BBL45834.1 hypothetical protein MJ1_0692 [Nanobdella aerobiophila]